MYLHTLPTTGALSFGDALVAPPGSGLGRELARATELRAALRAVLKERKHGDDGERGDWLSVVKVRDPTCKEAPVGYAAGPRHGESLIWPLRGAAAWTRAALLSPACH